MTTASAGPGPDGAGPGTTRRTRSVRRAAGVVLAILCGVGMATQSRVNGALGQRLDDSLAAAVVSFGGGLLLLVTAFALSRRLRAGVAGAAAALRSGRLRPWHCLGGVAGAAFVASQSVTVAVLGVAMFTVGVVAGQTVSGLFVDRAGLGPGGARMLTWPRVVAALLTLGAVASALAGDLAHQADPGRAWLLAFPLAAGAGMAVQQAFNGHVSAASGSALTAALVNFTAGTTVLVAGWLISLAVRGGPAAWPDNPVLYLGGPIGVVFIACAAVIVSWVGVLVFGLAAIAGQLVGSVVLDLLLPAAPVPLRASTLLGCGIALVAVALAGVGGRRATRAALEQSGA
ncbi:transporter family-2 protein [Prauserella shujinwangii]|uniref:Transporter family-2 protein n=1 Tax=Prauserella shujinwangii TaxID=1453103 RepID=A0A2T0LKE1_9PSEU|nr:DMT family transporter [Prauserella shujinwangii]PRX43313.1 transporter family-2 protein [Prauserella shujinwangii]